MEHPPDGPITDIAEPGIKAHGPLLFSMRKEVADLLGRSQVSFPGAQPVSFARQHLEELTRQDYFVCEKSDGIRYLLYTTEDETGGEAHYLIDRKNDYWFITNRNLHFPLENDLQSFHAKTVIDGELVWDVVGDNKREPRFLVFDCLVMDGKRIMDRTLDKRLAYFEAMLYKPYVKLFKDYPNERQFQPFFVEMKPFFVEMKPFQLAYGIEMMFKQVLPQLKHGNDGLIFTCRNTPYKHGTDPHILKWKPPEENTVDCRLRLKFPEVEPTESERREGITERFIDYDSVPQADLYAFAGGDRYEHFDKVYISEEQWEFMKSLEDPLDNRIVECNVDDRGRWRVLRFRDDKKEANHTSTITSVMESIQDRVSEKDLYAAAGRMRDSWKARAAKSTTK